MAPHPDPQSQKSQGDDMTPITRLERWIAPRAVPLLGVISVLIVAIGVAAYLVRQGDLRRVERLERTIKCQHSHECREFVERAIREVLRDQRQAPKDQSGQGHRGVTFRLGSKGKGSASPLVVEIPDTSRGHSPGQNSPPKSASPHGKSPGGTPQGDNPKGLPNLPENGINPGKVEKVPPPRQGKEASVPVEEPDPPAKGPVSSAGDKAEEALEGAKEIPCTALREVHGLC